MNFKKMFLIFSAVVVSASAMATSGQDFQPIKRLTGEEPVQISCGADEGPSVKFGIVPGKRTISYEAFQNGELVQSGKYYATPGIYDFATLSFSGNGYHRNVTIKGTFTEVLRINRFSSIELSLSKDWDSSDYQLHSFTEGQLITSSFDKVKIPTHVNQAYQNLKCTVVGL